MIPLHFLDYLKGNESSHWWAFIGVKSHDISFMDRWKRDYIFDIVKSTLGLWVCEHDWFYAMHMNLFRQSRPFLCMTLFTFWCLTNEILYWILKKKLKTSIKRKCTIPFCAKVAEGQKIQLVFFPQRLSFCFTFFQFHLQIFSLLK